MLKVYGWNRLTEKCYQNQKMDLTNFIYLSGNLKELNGFDVCSIPAVGHLANKYDGRNEIIEKCSVITHIGTEIDSVMHLVWNGQFYTGLIFAKEDAAAKKHSKEFAKEHSVQSGFFRILSC